MKGFVFNLLEKFVDQQFGNGVFDQHCEQIDLKTKEPFVGPGTYPDSDLFLIFNSVISKYSLKAPQVLRGFGKFLFPALAKLVPEYIEKDKGLFNFLERVDRIIHIEVKKLYHGAVLPKFRFLRINENEMQIQYESERKLCFLMEGLILEAAKEFKEDIYLKQIHCVHQDKECQHCLFHIIKV